VSTVAEPSLDKQMVAYTGRYTIAADKVIHHVDVAWNEAWIGTDLIRSYKITGDLLIITTAPTKYGLDAVEQVSTLALERVNLNDVRSAGSIAGSQSLG
jgi:hypothetical protein